MNSDKLKIVLYNALQLPDCIEYLKYLIEKSCCYSRSNNFNNVNQEYYNRGRKDFGAEILEDIMKTDFNKFVKLNIDYTIHEIGNENGSFITFPIIGSTYNKLTENETISLLVFQKKIDASYQKL